MLSRGMDFETQEGKRRYDVARTDFYMGASFNQDRIMNIARDKSNEYWRLTNGMIGDNEYADYYSAMAHGVGGHYGSTPDFAAKDMQALTDTTFGVMKLYDIGSGTSTSAMKTLYKDMRLSATEAAQTLVDLAQTANSANVPVEKYVQTVIGMIDSLRNQGVHGKQVERSMAALVGNNMRIEDAKSLVESQSRANESMARDINASAFFGMMAGQSGSPIELINQGYRGWDAQGNPQENYYQMMAERVMAEATMMGAIGGNSELGQLMMMDSLMNRGYGRQEASEVVDSLASGDTSIVAALLEKADEKKDGGQKALTEEVVNAKEKLAKAGEQVSIFQKLDTDMAEAQKRIGQAIHDYLNEPLAKFREGFSHALTTIVDLATDFAKALHDFVDGGGLSKDSTLGSAANWISENPGTALLATGVTLLGARYGLGKAGTAIGGALRNSSLATRIPNLGRLAAGGSTMAGLAITTGVVAGGAIALANIVRMFSDGTATVTAKSEEGDSLQKAMFASSELNDMANKPIDYSSEESKTSEESSTANASVLPENKDYTQLYKEIKNYDDEGKRHFDENQNPEKFGNFLDDLPDNGIGTTLATFSGLKNSWQGIKSMGWDGLKALTSFATNNTMNIRTGSDLTKALTAGAKFTAQNIGKAAPFLSFLGAGLEEGINEYTNPDQFSLGEHVARAGIRGVGSTAGMMLGGTLGSFLGPAGTAVGAFAGGYAGDYLSRKLINSSIGDHFGISDKAGEERENEKYQSRLKQSEEIYGDATKSIVNSNDDKSKAVGNALEKHGMKLEDLTSSQEIYLNDLFHQLQSMGIEDQLVAASLAGNVVGEMTAQQKSKVDEIFEKDPIATGQAMLDFARQKWNGGNPNVADMQDSPYATGAYISGAALKGTADNDDLLTLATAMDSGEKAEEMNGLANEWWDKGGADFRKAIENINKATGDTHRNTTNLFDGRRRATANAIRYAGEHTDDPMSKAILNGIAYAGKQSYEKETKQQLQKNLTQEKLDNPEEGAREVAAKEYGEEFVEQQTQSSSESENVEETADPVSATRSAMKSAENMMGEMAKFSKLSGTELLRDKFATGQLIFDGVTALSSNGRQMSLRGVRDSLRLSSGMHDSDLYGVGIHGAFSGYGDMLSNVGAMDLESAINEKMNVTGDRGITRRFGSGFGDASSYSKAIDEIADNYARSNKEQIEIYERQKENQEKAKQDMQKTLDSATINVYGVQTVGTDSKTNARLARLENKQNNMEERIEFVGETVNQMTGII